MCEALEVQRQLAMVQLGRHLAARPEDVFIVERMYLKLLGGHGIPPQGTAYAHIGARAQDLPSSALVTQYFGFETAIGLCARGETQARLVTSRLYGRLRQMDRRESTAGNETSRGIKWSLERHKEESLLSDHDSDHFTAMDVAVALESRVKRLLPGSKLVEIDLKFHSYLELSPGAEISFGWQESGSFAGDIRQLGVICVDFQGVALVENTTCGDLF